MATTPLPSKAQLTELIHRVQESMQIGQEIDKLKNEVGKGGPQVYLVEVDGTPWTVIVRKQPNQMLEVAVKPALKVS